MPKKTSTNLKFFLGSFFLSLPFWWGTNVAQENLEDFLFWSQIAKNPQILSAQIVPENKLIFSKPARSWQVENLKITAKSGISLLVDSRGEQHLLFHKDSDEKLPIASLSKLMSAYIVSENYDLSEFIEISHKAMKEEVDAGNFKIGDTFKIEDLLYSLLIESSNDAVLALAEEIGQEAMVDLMNLEAEAIGMENTHFFNPTGLDPDNPVDSVNYSTAEDMVKLANHLLKTAPKILEISVLPEYNLSLANGVFHHTARNTNKLLEELPAVDEAGVSSSATESRLRDEGGKESETLFDFANARVIVGSKTGWTPQAQGCLLLAIKAPKDRGVLINIILGSPNRFEEMKKLINWVNEAYKW